MASMDSIVCSQCTYEGLRPASDEPITACPECGTVGTVWINGKPPWNKPVEQGNHMVSTGIKIPRYLLHRVQVAADERCLGRNLLIRMLIEQGLDRLIPIEQLTKEKEADNERAANQGGGDDPGSSQFDRYQRGV